MMPEEVIDRQTEEGANTKQTMLRFIERITEKWREKATEANQ